MSSRQKKTAKYYIKKIETKNKKKFQKSVDKELTVMV